MTVYAGRYGPDNFVDPYGNPVKNTPFEVRQGGVLSTLYIDRDRTSTAANPGMSDALGNITFYAEPGFYDVTVGQTTLSLVVVPDPAEPGGGGGGAVDSVNAQTGVVVLGYSDVGAASAAQGATADSAVQPGDLAAVATTGDYDDLTGTPTIPSTPSEVGADPAGTAAALVDDLSGVSNQAAARTALGLGTAAVTAATDYASATQGGKADTAVQPGDLGTAASEDVGVPNGVATLDGGGKVPTGQLPALAVTDVFPVASQAAMLALAAERGDVAIRSDTNTSWILSAEPASTLSNWLQLATPPDAVLSVNGQAGVVSLAASDVGAATAAQGTTADSAVQPGDLAPVATSGAYPDLTGKPTIPSTAQDVDAVPVTSIGLLPGERNRGDWDNAATYEVGDVVHDHNGDGQMYVANAPSTGEQPSLGLGSWTLADEMGRSITIGAGASADPNAGAACGFLAEAGSAGTAIGAVASAGGTAGTAIGAITSAAGDYATGVGYYANASGLGGVAVGSGASAAGRASTAIGTQASAPSDGDVNVANIITGHIDPDTYQADEAIVVPGGGVDLAETTLATDPATDHQRIVARTDGIYVRDDTGTEVGPLIPGTPYKSGGIGYRPVHLDTWWTALVAKASSPVDVVVLGDSIAEQDTPTGLRSWPYHLERLLNDRGPSGDITDGWRSAQAGVAQIPGSTTATGTPTNEATGGRGLTMSNGQTATYTATMDGVSIVYGKDPSYGSLEVRDGATLLATITTTGTAKGGFVWTSGALTSASHTITVTSVGANRFAGWQIHNGNRAAGVRIWNASRGGMGTDFFTTSSARGLDLVENLQPDLVILATGTNDAAAATYDTRMRALVTAVRAVYSGPIALWIPPVSTGYFAADAPAAGRLIVADESLAVIDAAAATGEHPLELTRWLGLGPHPGDEGTMYLASYAAAQLSGDPVGEALRQDYLSTLNLYGLGGKVSIAAPQGSSSYGLQGLSLLDTLVQRTAAGTLAVGSVLSILLSAPDGVVWAGRRTTFDAQTGTSYATPLASIAKTIVRNNVSASTHTWPKDATQAIPVGSVIDVLNVGAGIVTHSAEVGASLTTGSATVQAQGESMTAFKTAANTWHLVLGGNIAALAASRIASGTIATARLGSGTANSTVYLRGDQTWAAAPTETLPATIIDAAGDLIVGSGSDAATRLAVGTAGQVLGSDGTTVKWQAGGVVRATRTGAHYGPVGSSAGTDNTLMAAVDRWWGVVMYLPAGTYDQMQLATSVAGTSTMAVGVYPCSSNGYPATGAAVLAAGGDVNLSAAAGVLTSAISLTLAVPTVVAVMGSITAYTSAATFRTIAAYADPGISNGQLGLPVQPLSTSTGGGVLAGVQGLASGSTAGVSTFPSGLSLGYSVPKFRMRAA